MSIATAATCARERLLADNEEKRKLPSCNLVSRFSANASKSCQANRARGRLINRFRKR